LEEAMREILKKFIGKTLRIYTVSGVDSYLGILEDVSDEHIRLKSFFKEDKTYLSISHIESFKLEEKQVSS
jgi:hypothetical protein